MLLPNDLYENALFAPAVELAVEDLLPRPKVEISVTDGDNYFPAHDLAFEVRIAVVLTSTIVTVMVYRFVRGKLLKPISVVLVKP